MPERTTKRAVRTTKRTGRAVTDTIENRSSTNLPPLKSKSGVPINDALADKLAQEAERGYACHSAARFGRKSPAGGSGHSPRLNFRTMHNLYERAAARAEREGKTVSQLSREALEKFVK